MNLLFDNWIITFSGNTSKYEIDKILNNAENKVITLGEDSYWKDIFLLYINSTNGNTQFWIVIFSESTINPSIINYKDNNIAIGFNHQIKIINLSIPKIVFQKDFLGVFLYAKYIGGKLIVISEISISVLNENLHEILFQPTDVIESFEFFESYLICKTQSETHKIYI